MSTFPEPQISADPERGARVARDDRAHVFHSWSAQALIDPLPIAGARGPTSGTTTGKRYLDFSSQLVNVNIGYQHPKLVAAIQEQAARLCTVAPSVRRRRRGPRRRGSSPSLAPGDLDMVFFTNGGAEANENAIRMARLHTGRHKVLAAYRSYHGATAGAISADRRPAPLGERAGHARRRALLGPVPLPLRLPRDHRGAGVRARAAAPARHDHGRGARDRSRRSCSRPWWAPTASSCRRPATSPACARSATSTASS